MENKKILERIRELERQLAELKKENAKDGLNPDDPKDVFTHAWSDLEKNFKWKNVQKMMAAVNWRWFDVDGELQVSDIKEHAKELVRECIEKKTRILCGGFEVEYNTAQDAAEAFGEEPEKGVWPTVALKFVGEEWESFFKDEEDDEWNEEDEHDNF